MKSLDGPIPIYYSVYTYLFCDNLLLVIRVPGEIPCVRYPVRSTRVPLVNVGERVPHVLPKPRHVFQKLLDGHDFEDELPQEVPGHVAKHPQQVVAIAKLFPSLFIFLKNDFHVVLRKFVQEVLDPEVLVVDFVISSPNLDVLDVHNEAVNLERINLLGGSRIGREHIVTMSNMVYAEGRRQLFDRRDPAARNVPVLPVGPPPGPVELVIVRVVDPTGLYLHGVPVERGVTVGAPHLRATADLENHGPALGARLGVLLEKRDRLHVVRVARVSFVAFDLVTVGADVVFANLTLPPGRQKPAAVFYGTLADKLSLFGLYGLASRQYDVFAMSEGLYVYANFVNLRSLFFYELVDVSPLDDPRGHFLSLGEEAPFALKQDRLAVLLELRVAEHLGTGPVHNLAGPQILTPHTVGIARH